MKALLLLLSLLSYQSLFALSEPYQSIRILPFDNTGFFINERQIEALLKTRSFKTIIEVGSWLGMSTRFIAERVSPMSKVYAVDTWKGTLNEECHQKDPRLPHLYQLFLSNVRHAGLTEVIVPIRMESLEAAKALDVQADLIYIDAAHDTASVYADIMAWYPHLVEGGVLCGDDWGWESVRTAVIMGAQTLGKQIHADGYFWQYY